METIRANAKKFLPNKNFIKGKNTIYTDIEATTILEGMKCSENTERATSRDTLEVIKGTNTKLTPLLKVKNIVDNINTEEEENLLIQASMHLLSKRINKMQSENKNLLEQNQELKNDRDFLQKQSRIQNELLDIFREKLDPRTDKQKHRAKYVFMQD
jgi:hypothetical protein